MLCLFHLDNPTITTDFSEDKFVVTEGTISHLEVIVDANPSATIDWYISRNGTYYKKINNNIQTIQVAVIRDFENKYKSRLIFPAGLTRKDQAWYSLRIRNKLGSVKKNTYVVVNCKYWNHVI